MHCMLIRVKYLKNRSICVSKDIFSFNRIGYFSKVYSSDDECIIIQEIKFMTMEGEVEIINSERPCITYCDAQRTTRGICG